MRIKPRPIKAKKLQTNLWLSAQEASKRFPFVPSGFIYIQPDRVFWKSVIDFAKTGEESFSVSFRRYQQCHPSRHRSNSSKDIQHLLMLTGSEDLEPLTDFAPPSTKTRVQGKTGLIFKKNNPFNSQEPRFFFTCGGNFRHLCYGPANRYPPPASFGIQPEASRTELGALSVVFQNELSSAPLRSHRPNVLDSIQTPQASSPDDLPTYGELWGSAEMVASVTLQALGITTLSPPPCASTNSCSDGSNRAVLLSIPDPDPPVSAEEPESLFQKRVPGYPELVPKKRSHLTLDELISDLGFA